MIFAAAWMTAVSAAGFCQLRLNSPYYEDRINTDHTYFVLYDSSSAYFVWTSEWTQPTVQRHYDKPAVFFWCFKDGTVAYSRQLERLEPVGKNLQYIQTSEAPDLLDARGNPTRPLTLENYPVKLELWITGATDDNPFSPLELIDTVCLGEQEIEYEYGYYFSECP
jgi:hypothetical protein